MNQFRDIMRAKCVSHADLGESLGVSRSAVSLMLREHGNLTLDSIERIAEVLGCDVALDLIWMDDE